MEIYCVVNDCIDGYHQLILEKSPMAENSVKLKISAGKNFCAELTVDLMELIRSIKALAKS